MHKNTKDITEIADSSRSRHDLCALTVSSQLPSPLRLLSVKIRKGDAPKAFKRTNESLLRQSTAISRM